MARKRPQLSKEEKARQNQLTEAFFVEIEKLKEHPENEDFTIPPAKREAFITAGDRLRHIVETARKSGAKGGSVVSDAKKAHLQNIASNPRPGRAKPETSKK